MTRKVAAFTRDVTVDFDLDMQPEPSSLMDRAMKEQGKPPTFTASSYGAVINTLRNKGFTWRECAEWLTKHGASYSMQAVTAGYRQWLKWEGEK